MKTYSQNLPIHLKRHNQFYIR